LRKIKLEGFRYCYNEGCDVVGQLKEFKVCPQCKIARYCGEACQQQDWTTGGHKATCRTLIGKEGQTRFHTPAQQGSEYINTTI